MPREDHEPVTMSIHGNRTEFSKEGLVIAFLQRFVEGFCCGDGSGLA
jgi:hypothetical protein